MEKQGRTDAQRTIDELAEALQRNRNAKGGVAINEKDELEIIYYQSGQMGKWFEKFPEILLVDGTYCVNKAGMPLYALMVEDGCGHGQVVHYATISSEDSAHIESIFQSFKECNPSWDKVSVIFIDKDFTEWNILSQEFPNATLLFCQFHVVKCLFKKVSDCEVPKEKRESIRDILRRIVHSKSEDEYQDLKRELLEEANDKFCEYILKNWNTCQSMWVSFQRDNFVHFANTTNNRLENSHSKLKQITHHSDSLSQMFRILLLQIGTCASEYAQTAFQEEFKTSCTADDQVPGVAQINLVCTRYAAGLIVEQLKVSSSVAYVVTSQDSRTFNVKFNDRHYTVQLSDDDCTCSCSFWNTMQLPC